MLFQLPVAPSVTIQLLCGICTCLRALFSAESKNFYVWQDSFKVIEVFKYVLKSICLIKLFLKKYFARYDVYLVLVCLFKDSSKLELESKGEFCFSLGSWRVRSSKEKQVQTSHGLHRWTSKKTKDLDGAFSEMELLHIISVLAF